VVVEQLDDVVVGVTGGMAVVLVDPGQARADVARQGKRRQAGAKREGRERVAQVNSRAVAAIALQGDGAGALAGRPRGGDGVQLGPGRKPPHLAARRHGVADSGLWHYMCAEAVGSPVGQQFSRRQLQAARLASNEVKRNGQLP
jgi:hypothetical protein